MKLLLELSQLSSGGSVGNAHVWNAAGGGVKPYLNLLMFLRELMFPWGKNKWLGMLDVLCCFVFEALALPYIIIMYVHTIV